VTGQSDKPGRLLDRDHEWDLLNEFLADPATELRLAIVSGRRRNGKSFLLEALTEAVGGLYLTAVQEEGRVPALHRFTETIAAHAGVRPGAMRLDDWRDALTAALDVVNRAAGAPLIVIDELPYLMQHSPEIPGFLQLLYDQSQSGKARRDEEIDDVTTEANPEVAERHAEITEDVDDLLDEIDSVLEENAEEFVRGYVQKGGQ